MKRGFLKFHHAFGVVAVVFFALLAAAGVRSTPAVLMVPWGHAFGWSRGVISFAAATGIFLFGFTGPFAAAAMQRFGVRRTVMLALALMSGSALASLADDPALGAGAQLGRGVGHRQRLCRGRACRPPSSIAGLSPIAAW